VGFCCTIGEGNILFCCSFGMPLDCIFNLLLEVFEKLILQSLKNTDATESYYSEIVK